MNLNSMNLKYECKLEVLEGRGWAQRFKTNKHSIRRCWGVHRFYREMNDEFLR